MKCWGFVCVFNSVNLNYYQAFFLQYKPLDLWWEINQLLHQFYTVLFSTIQHSPLPLLTPRDQWPVWAEAPGFTFTLLAPSGCLAFHPAPSCNADAVGEEGLASSGKKNGVKSRCVHAHIRTPTSREDGGFALAFSPVSQAACPLLLRRTLLSLKRNAKGWFIAAREAVFVQGCG